jgi:putative DNA primase/helicase
VRGRPGTPEWFGHWDESGQLDQSRTLATFPGNELDAADLIRAERSGHLSYVPSGRIGTWYIWNGRCHAPDDSMAILQLANDYAVRAETALRVFKQLVLRRSRAGVLAADPDASNTAIEQAAKKAWDPWNAAEGFTRKLRSTAGRNGLVASLMSRSGVSEALLADRHPEWVNFGNGTVDVRSQMIKPHDPADMITYVLPHNYNPAARAPGWEALLWHVAGENPAIARYLVKMLGYSLLGDNRKQLIFFLTGPTGSGKSQLVETVAKVLGPLAHASSSALISRNKTERHARVEHSIVGKRFIYIDESAERISVDEGQLKRLTGSSTMSVNRLYRDTEVQVTVSWTPWQATNEMPTLNGFDDAIRRRIRCIPCGSTIPEEAREEGLSDRLARDEAEGILAWLVQGAHDYLMEGEQCPAEVELATREYEAEQNTAEAFRLDCCQDVPAYLNGSGAGSAVSVAQMRREYVAWCQQTRTPMLPKHAFNKAFRELPGIQYDANQKRYTGIMVVQSYMTDSQDLR